MCFRELPVYQIGSLAETFDLVWFMGVFYHLRHPLLALDLIAECCRGQLVFQTLTLPCDQPLDIPADMELDERRQMTTPGWPAMAFIEHRLANDPTNWWAPNHAAVEALLRSSGFAIESRPTDETWICRRKETDSQCDDQRRRELTAVFSRA